MTSREIRKQFLDYFVQRDHRRVASSPLVLPNDPTLLFANAGMNQFKDVFTGRETRDYSRATSSQKCLRVSGKHNDLEMVGRTPRHHTFFEMLGNFSFGDYFKREAIRLAWALLTEEFGVPKERLWATVFEGDAQFEADEEAHAIWRDEIGIPEQRIMRLPASENFWSMGDVGPCGPCTELHYDLGEDLTSVSGESNPDSDSRRYIEIWNLVFMQFDRDAGGEVTPLPAPSVDTGMGLERLAAVLQGKRSNFDTDCFVPLLDAIAQRAGVRRGAGEESDFSMRVIADHARALAFLVADGVVPANDKRGYVLRRLLRRAIRHGRKLGINEPFLHEVTPVLIDQMDDVYPELGQSRDAILEVGRREEERFSETLATGLGMLEASLAEVEGADGGGVLPGEELFRLYDSFGFPVELARDIAEERGVTLDDAGFEACMAKQRERAQASWKSETAAESAEVYRSLAGAGESRFEGYTELRCEDVPLVALLDSDGNVVEELTEGTRGQALLEATPFYAESGGQIADRGWLSGGDSRAHVSDVNRPLPGLIVHDVEVESGRLRVADRVTAEVDAARRDSIRRNHTATHLIHAALREVVGTHVKQAGSRVGDDRLRFDFSHFTGLTDRAMADIESLCNRKVLEDLPIETEVMPIEEALSSGAMALFGEKYGDRVRVVKIGDFSTELCGGTHCAASGQIGLIKLTQERGVASGTRRVEAISGVGSLERFRREAAIVQALEGQLSVPAAELEGELRRRLEELKALQRELEQQKLGQVRGRLMQRAEKPQKVAGVSLLTARVDGMEPGELRELADSLKQKLGSGVVVLGRAEAAKASVLVAVTADLTDKLPAGELVRALGRLIGGGGGGKPDLAEAGGKDPASLDKALQAAVAEIESRMEATG